MTLVVPNYDEVAGIYASQRHCLKFIRKDARQQDCMKPMVNLLRLLYAEVRLMKGKLSLLSLVLLSFSSQASQYAPVFSGHWYTDAQLVNQDACYQNSYQYTNLASGTDRVYATSVLRDLSPHTNCQWGSAFLTAKQSTRPLDFNGTNEQWQNIRTQKNAVTAESWQRNCVQGKTVLDNAVTTIWPSYACPAGTHDGLIAGYRACTDEPLVCSADIVGRNLDLTNAKANKILGQVGLVSTLSGQSTVLEVLPKPPAVYENTLKSFKEKSKFWGEKFGLPDAPKLTLAQARKIITASQTQKGVTLKYTLGWKWNPGDKDKKIDALFRCDSFVYYSYLAGAALKIFPSGFHFPFTPPDMFDQFLTFRTGRYHDSGTPPAIMEKIQPYTIIPTDNGSYNERLEQVFSEPDLDVAVADQLTYRYVYANYISRTEKMKVLYDLAVKHQQNHVAFLYLIDILGALEPSEYLEKYITLYQQQSDSYVKDHFLSSIATVAIHLITSGEALSLEQQKSSSLTKALFKNTLEHETNPDILTTAINLYQDIGGPEYAKAGVDAALLRAEQNHITLRFTPGQLLLTKIGLAFDTKDTQSRDLPELLNPRNQMDAKLMPFYLTFFLQDFTSSKINDQLRPLLKNYLLKYQAVISQQYIGLKNYDPAIAICDWLAAYATVMVKKDSDKIPFIYDYIRALSSPVEQAKYLDQLTWQVGQKISNKDRAFYQDRFQRKLTDPTLSDDDRTLLENTLAELRHRYH